MMNTDYPALLGYDDENREQPHPIAIGLQKGARLVALEAKLEFRNLGNACFNLRGQLDDGSVHLFSAWWVHPRLFEAFRDESDPVNFESFARRHKTSI